MGGNFFVPGRTTYHATYRRQSAPWAGPPRIPGMASEGQFYGCKRKKTPAFAPGF